MFQGVLHNGTGVIHLAGIQIDTGAGITIAVYISGGRIIHHHQAIAKEIMIPQRREYPVLPHQRGCIQQANHFVMKIEINRIILSGYSLHDFRKHVHRLLLFQMKGLIRLRSFASLTNSQLCMSSSWCSSDQVRIRFNCLEGKAPRINTSRFNRLTPL